MSDVTQLAYGQLTPADQLVVQLLRPARMAAVTRIIWPSQPTIVDPKQYADAALDSHEGAGRRQR